MGKSFENVPSECILVCISYGPNAERLIRRGWRIAQSLTAPLYILSVCSVNHEVDTKREDHEKEWKKLAKQYNGSLMIVENKSKKVSEIIANVAREKHVSQIVIGQSPRTRWEEILRGSIINEILNQIEFIDVHIVSVQRELPQMEDEFEKGVRAYLIKEDEGYSITYNSNLSCGIEGMFFRDIHTDFDNGLFIRHKDHKKVTLRVHNGTIDELEE
ncbi:universal stress protein [Bacillus horti]|uniref:K+-sensing histidine kinase KdpD n=1 Tax=Caldalkalibacillus horti TaxID=77523 RepID=A0ABT9VZ37_9BACI|nr:universal stress protein [Bacillus horti]MDQ0166256.1 K+-sensing histidine kinase KdpD [Bacillus horti]